MRKIIEFASSAYPERLRNIKNPQIENRNCGMRKIYVFRGYGIYS